MFASLSKNSGAIAAAKGGTLSGEQQQLEAERAAAAQTIAKQHVRIKKPMEHMHFVAGPPGFLYCYMAGSLIGVGALTFAISSKFPAFTVVGSVASVVAGFYGGPMLYEFHVMALKQNVCKELDQAIQTLEDGDRKHGDTVTLYRREVRTLRAMRQELMPSVDESVHHVEQPQANNLDGRIDQMLAQYERRRGSLPGSDEDSAFRRPAGFREDAEARSSSRSEMSPAPHRGWQEG